MHAYLGTGEQCIVAHKHSAQVMSIGLDLRAIKGHRHSLGSGSAASRAECLARCTVPNSQPRCLGDYLLTDWRGKGAWGSR